MNGFHALAVPAKQQAHRSVNVGHTVRRRGSRITARFPLLLKIIVALSISCCTANDQAGQTTEEPLFVEVLEGRIATDGGSTRGVAWGDFDGDHDPDLYVANSQGQWNAFYRNEGNGTFKKLTEHDQSPWGEVVRFGGNSEGVNWVDFDNDGDLDLYVANRGPEPNFLFRNEGSDGFVRVHDHPLTAEGLSTSMACWADVDRDGDLDVFLASYGGQQANAVFRNLGEGRFEPVSTSVLATGQGAARTCAWGDADNDGLPDLYVGNARRPNFFFRNRGDWRFEAVESGHLVTDVGYSYGVSWADYDDDGDLDLFLANFDKENFLYNNNGQGDFTVVSTGSMALEKGGASKGHAWGDYDNDGDLDLFVANGTYRPDMRNFLYLNRGDGTFHRDTTGTFAVHADTSAGAAWADYDRDGDLDLFVASWGSSDQVNRLYQNQTSGQHWLSIRLVGERSNHYGIGARVQLKLQRDHSTKQQNRWMFPVTGYGSQNDYEIHFGLGDYSVADTLVIRWPSGQIDVHTGVLANTHWVATEGGNVVVASDNL